MKKFAYLSILLLISLLIACAGGAEEAAPAAEEVAAPPAPEPVKAVAQMAPTEGNSVEGTVTFEQMEGGIHVSASITGLTPGSHGFHIHENGDCSAPDGTSAGGHFNPAGVDHGGPGSEVKHVGDLGNLVAGDDGTAEYHAMLDYLSLNEGDPNYIVGRGVIIHASEDDLKSQPTGAAGARLACGVIE